MGKTEKLFVRVSNVFLYFCTFYCRTLFIRFSKYVYFVSTLNNKCEDLN
jgi:hypothetical protein